MAILLRAQTWRKIKELLGNYGVSVNDFYCVLDALMDFCDRMADILNDVSLVFAGAALLLFNPCPPASGFIALGALCLQLESRTWDRWRDMLEELQDLVDEDRER